MTTRKVFDGKTHAGNPHLRCDEGQVAPTATLKRGSLLCKTTKTTGVQGCRLIAFLGVALIAGAAHCSTNVFNDAVFWFRGGKDKNSDGYIDYGEFFDDLRANTPNDGNHNMTMSSTLYTGAYGSLFKGNAVFRKEEVVFPALGTSAVKDDVQVLHISADAQGGSYYFPFAVNPHSVFVRNEISNEYTIVSRIRLDDNSANRNEEKCFLKVGYSTNDLARQQGMWLGFAKQNTTTKSRQITGRRISDSTGNDSAFNLNLHVPTNTWVDMAVVVGSGKLRVGIALPQSLADHSNNPTIAFDETDIRTDSYELLESDADYLLFCRDGQKIYKQANATDRTCFIGSVQQMAIWKRALGDQEVMAAFGMPRPAIFRMGFDNGNSNEFGGTRTNSTQIIDGLGSWQGVWNEMRAKDEWTVSFNALRDEANLPQIFSVKSLRGSAAQIEVKLNGTSLGEGRVAADTRAFWPVAANIVHEGANELVIKCKDAGIRGFLIDAMELGGSLGVGKMTASSTDDGRVDPELIKTGVPSATDPNPQHWPTKLEPSTGIKDLHFRVWIDPDVADKASFTLKTAAKCDAISSSEKFSPYVNGAKKGDVSATNSWKQLSLPLKAGDLLGGWNDIDFYSTNSRCWEFGYFRFEAVLPSAFGFSTPPGLAVSIR